MSRALIICLILLVSCQKEEVIFDVSPNANFELPILLRIDGKDCLLDAESHTLKYSIESKSLENYTPFIEFQPHSEITLGSKVLQNGSENDLGSFSINQAYPVRINTKGVINEFSLIFTELPLVQIVMHDDIPNEPKSLSRMTIHYPQSNKISVRNWAGVEYRGASTFKYDKKSLGIDIFQDRSLENEISASYFDLKPNNKWILDAMYADRSRLRNKVSFEIWRSMLDSAIYPSIEARFVEVFINHESQGLFAFMENYSEEFLSLSSESVLYKGVDNLPETKFTKFPEQKTNSALWSKWQQVFPDPKSRIEWDDFKALSKLIVESDDDEFNRQIDLLVDLDNIIDYYLLINLMRGTDSVGKNWFFIKHDKNSKFTILPWDMDRTWGRSIFRDEMPYTKIITNGLFTRLVENNPSQFNQRVKTRWNELRKTTFSEATLFGLFGDSFDVLTRYRAESLENNLWDADLDINEERMYIETWTKNRLDFLDGHFSI